MDVAKLRGIIAERGFSQRGVAKMLGISEKTFYAKMKNGTFWTDEAECMIRLLRIDDPVGVFFTTPVA